MKYTYFTTEKDMQEACYKSIFALERFQKKRLFFSLVYPLPIFLLLLRPNQTLIIVFSAYVFLVLFFYFYYFQKTLFNRKRYVLNKGKTWKDKQAISLTENEMIVSINDVQQKINWDRVEKLYETNSNIILYLFSNSLDFIIIKKPAQKEIRENAKPLFSFLEKKLKNKLSN